MASLLFLTSGRQTHSHIVYLYPSEIMVSLVYVLPSRQCHRVDLLPVFSCVDFRCCQTHWETSWNYIRNVRTISFCRKDSCWRTSTFWCVRQAVLYHAIHFRVGVLRCGKGSCGHPHHFAAVCESVSMIASKLKLEKARSAFNFNMQYFFGWAMLSMPFIFIRFYFAKPGRIANLIKVIQRWAEFMLNIIFLCSFFRDFDGNTRIWSCRKETIPRRKVVECFGHFPSWC